jgi:hypothetical protein
MMTDYLKTFSQSAKDLSRNPLGIIALFIVLVYGFACLLFGYSADTLTPSERTPLIWFVILFPVLVLLLFGWLVSKHHKKLYAPSDYRDDKSFLQTLQQQPLKNIQSGEASDKNIRELMEYGKGFEIIAEQEERIKKDLEARELDSTGATNTVLIRHLASSQVLHWFDRTYNTLFGSQIALLKQLSTLTSGMTLEATASYFENVKRIYTDQLATWSLDQYLQYPIESGLFEKRENKILITKAGKEFLALMTNAGYSEDKNL